MNQEQTNEFASLFDSPLRKLSSDEKEADPRVLRFSILSDCGSFSSALEEKEPKCLLPHRERTASYIFDFSYRPANYSIVDDYQEITILCQMQLSPTVVSLVVEDETDIHCIKKSILKSKLVSPSEE